MIKRLTATALISCMILTAFTGCLRDKEEEPDDNAVRAALLYEFQRISQIPRESGNEKEISLWLKDWAKENGLEAVRDSSNNVIITLPASPGYEDAPVTIIHSNMDSKIVVSEDSAFDPLSDPVAVTDDGIMLHAEGTSIGADSGAGMATALYLLKHARRHGPIRAVFTANGESTLTGAEKLNEKYLEGDYLIDLAWDSGDTIGIGSGGTAVFSMTRKIVWTEPQNALPYMLSLSGLNGGDAAKDIGSGGANAIKIIGEILANAQGRGILFELGSFNGGTSGDTIASSASALIIINESDANKMQDLIDGSISEFDDAYGDVEENYNFTYEECPMPERVVSFEDTGSIISFIYGILNGVQSMSEKYEGVVESASNLGTVSTAGGDFVCQVFASSTSYIELFKIRNAHEAISGMSGMDYTYHDGVPHWPDRPNSVLFSAIQDIWSELYGYRPDGAIVHHSLEFGWFARKNPKLQIISIGPVIENPGQPDEALVLEALTRPANVVITLLERINGIGKASVPVGNN